MIINKFNDTTFTVTTKHYYEDNFFNSLKTLKRFIFNNDFLKSWKI